MYGFNKLSFNYMIKKNWYVNVVRNLVDWVEYIKYM